MSVPPEQIVRALVVMPLSEQRGGSEVALLHLIEHGRGHGVEWSVAFFHDGPMVEQVRRWGVEANVLNAGRLRQPHRFARSIWRLRNILRRRKINVVLSWMGMGHLYGGTAALLAGVRATWFQHGLPDPPGWLDRAATRLPARTVLACSSTTAAAQRRVRPERPVMTVYPGVDVSRFDPDRLPTPAECRAKLGLPTAGPLLCIVARLQMWKGIHHLVDAMPAILKRHSDAHAVVVGGRHDLEPDYPAFLNARVRGLGLDDRVLRVGLQANVPEWMQAADVIVHASDSEPFGLVVIEAMALGKPTVATHTAGPTEIVTDGVDGLLWPPGDAAALADAVCRALADGSSLTEAARRRAQAFMATAYAAKVAAAVRAVAEGA